MFLSFYSIFCLGSTKNEGHICNLHAKTQLLMYDKGGLLTKKFSTPEGRWRTVRKPGLDENSGFEWKNLYFQYQWPKRNSFQGYSFLILKKVLFWDTLIVKLLSKPWFQSQMTDIFTQNQIKITMWRIFIWTVSLILYQDELFNENP